MSRSGKSDAAGLAQEVLDIDDWKTLQNNCLSDGQMEEIIQMGYLFPFKGKTDEYAHVEQPTCLISKYLMKKYISLPILLWEYNFSAFPLLLLFMQYTTWTQCFHWTLDVLLFSFPLVPWATVSFILSAPLHQPSWYQPPPPPPPPPRPKLATTPIIPRPQKPASSMSVLRRRRVR